MLRLSEAFFRTLREAPSGIAGQGLRRLARAGYVRAGSSGLVVQPAGVHILRQIERELLERSGGDAQEIELPRCDRVGALAEAIASTVQSHRDVPRRLVVRGPIERGASRYEDEAPMSIVQIGPAGGANLLAGGLRWLRALAWPSVEAEAIGMADSDARAMLVESERAGTGYLRCPGCGVAALSDAAVRAKVVGARQARGAGEVATPGATTIAALAGQLQIEAAAIGKTLVYSGESRLAPGARRLVAAVLRGDMALSVAKLERVTGLRGLRPATLEELSGCGIAAGYGSPVGAVGVTVVADDVIPLSGALVMGANREGFHRWDVVCGRDFVPDAVADLAAPEPGDACSRCGAPLRAGTGVGVAWLHPGLSGGGWPALDIAGEDGMRQPLDVSCLEVFPMAMLEMAAEVWGSDEGLHLPAWMSPWAAHIVALDGGEGSAAQVAAGVEAAGLNVIHDDRDLRAGVKFADADWMGVPIRVVIGKRGVAQGIGELALWRDGIWERREVSLDRLALQVVESASPRVM